MHGSAAGVVDATAARLLRARGDPSRDRARAGRARAGAGDAAAAGRGGRTATSLVMRRLVDHRLDPCCRGSPGPLRRSADLVRPLSSRSPPEFGEGNGVADKVIENPILNRPYEEPTRHLEFDAEGITNRVAARRRPSSHFSPVPASRKGSRQLELTELTADLIQPNELANRIRDHVGVWRAAGYDNVAPTTRRLLELGGPGAGEQGPVLPARGGRDGDLSGRGGPAHRRRLDPQRPRRHERRLQRPPQPRCPEDGDRIRQDRGDGDADRLAGAEQGRC